MICMRRAGVHLFAADVRENPFLVARIFFEQFFHGNRSLAGFGQLIGTGAADRAGFALGLCVVKRESHAQHIATHKTLARVGMQPRRVVVVAGLPKTALVKVQKALLRESLLSVGGIAAD